MAKQDYIPTRLGDLSLWLKTYKAKLVVHKKTLSISDVDFAAQNAFIDTALNAIEANEQVQKDAQKSTNATRAQLTTSVRGIRAQAQNFKTLKTYTNAIGEDLGIVGDEQTVDVEKAQPKLKARKLEAGYELSFNLLKFFDAVKIFRQRPGEQKRFIAVDTSSPYVDAEPMVSGTQYTAFFLLGDDTVGIESDPLVITI